MLRAVVWDPDLVSRRTIVSLVKLAGYELVEQPSSPQEALDLAGRVEPTALVFAVPDDGAQWSTALAELSERAPGTMLIALSADDDLRAKAQAAGAGAVLDPDRPRFLDHLTEMLPRQTAVRGDDSGDEWLPLREAAHAAAVPLARLRHWCDRGSVPFRKEGGRRLVLVDDVRARARAEAGQEVAGEEPQAVDGDVRSEEPVAEPEPAPEPDSEPEPEPEPEAEPEPENLTVPVLSWAKPEGAPQAPPRRSYDLIPDADASRRGRRRR